MDWFLHQIFGSQFEAVKAAALAGVEQFLTTNPNASEGAVSGFITTQADSFISPIAGRVSPTFHAAFVLLANVVIASETKTLYDQALAAINAQVAQASAA